MVNEKEGYTKAILITNQTHSRIKEFCDEYGFKMQGWIDHALREKLDNLNK